MKRIGITGNIGSGKSLVCKIFNHLGINTFFSDEETKKLYLLPDIKEQILNYFNDEVYFKDGSLNKKLLSYHLFRNHKALQFIEEILYPKLNATFDKWCERQTTNYVLFESAILFEKKFSDQFEKIIFVSAPEDIRLQRTMLRDRCNEENVRARMRLQWDEDTKKAESDFIIFNDGDKMLIPQVLEIHKILQTL
ncbi:MAG: dephospho-CoA kinase [Lentimicrobiaceae bacterium]|nr:dephospho-CoA kinase [Lentimicrobiaceae bacterium]